MALISSTNVLPDSVLGHMRKTPLENQPFPPNGRVSKTLIRPTAPIQHWIAHFNALEDNSEIYRVEARDYVSRLETVLPISHDLKVMDFGCGLGFVAELLAPRVKKLLLWDASTNMARRTRQRVINLNNAYVLDRLDPNSLNGPYIDVILVNSVTQYMSAEELCLWIGRWCQMLLPGGRLVISDIVPSQARAHVFSDALLFYRFHKFSSHSFFFAFKEFRRYWKMRKDHPLLRLSREELRDQATVARLAVEFLPANLTYRKDRLSVVFRKAI